MKLALIDAIGPFFRDYDKRRINWSKIPFRHLATEEPERSAQWKLIREEMNTFASRAAAAGYNAVSLDDVAHLSVHAWFEPEVRERHAVLREELRLTFEILQSHGLAVYMTADFLTTSPAVDARIGNSVSAAVEWFGELTTACLDDFPQVAGIILRIGESDGVDVRETLRSRLFLRTARQVNHALRSLLPVFEKRNRRLILRTWTVGAHLVGDLIWHPKRLMTSLRGIDSPAFAVSMKYGESDFFRYLPLNRQFFRVSQPKVIEFQARREYEGAGEYPSFTGWDCEHYMRELAGANVIGFSVWCQTGGWHAFRRRAFLEPEAVWIDLNTVTTLRIALNGETVEEAVAGFFGREKAPAALEFLRLAEIVIRDLLYIEEFARQKLFFRRVRIPPLLHVYWDSIFINDPVRRVMAHFVYDPEGALRSGEAAFTHFDRMIALAETLGLPSQDIAFMRDTFAIILLARRYYLLPADASLLARIEEAKAAYKERWPRTMRQRYRVRLDFEPARVNRLMFDWLLRVLIRHQRGYRPILDRIFTLNALSWMYRLFSARHQKALPKFLRKSAMGVDTLFR